MSDQTPPTGYTFTPEPQPAKKSRKGLAWAVFGIVAAFGIGASMGGPGEPAPAPEPKVITETVEVEKEVEVVKEVTPDVCLAALDSAEKVIDSGSVIAGIAAEYIDMIPRAAEAGAAYDVAEIEAMTSEMEELTQRTQDESAKVDNSKYGAQAEKCRAAAN